MKKLVLAIALVMCASMAFAAPWGQNNVGVYLDPGGTVFCDPVLGGGQHHAYVVGTGMAMPFVKGFEFKLTFEGGGAGILIDTVEYLGPPNNAINLANLPNEFVVALGVPVPATSTMVLMEFDFGIFSPFQPTLVYLTHVYNPTIGDRTGGILYGAEMAYLDENNEAFPLYSMAGDPLNPDPYLPVMVLNGDCTVVDTEEETWGGVKSMYR